MEQSVELPDPFRLESGNRVRSGADWQRRRREMRDLIVDIEYGGLPPVPQKTWLEELDTSALQARGGAKRVSCRVATGPDRPFSFMLNLLVPPGSGPFPVVLNGDACWQYVTEAVAAEVLRRGNILAQFDRVEIVPDTCRSELAEGS